MPINIPNGLPAKAILESEKIFALEEDIAKKQDIRPLKVAILNLMPKKIETETQILRLISKSPLQVDIDFMKVSSHRSKNTSADHLVKFYDNFDVLRRNYYDGLIITGAPVEHLPYEEVDYWEEHTCVLHHAHLLGRAGRTVLSLRHRQAPASAKDVRHLSPEAV